MGRPKGAISKLADELDVDAKTVRRALEAAGIPLAEVEPDFNAAIEAVRPFIDNERVIGHQATRVTTNPVIADARTRMEELKVRKLEIENAKAEGALIERAAVTQTGAHIIATARTALLSLGHRLAAKVAGKTDLREIASIVETEVRDVLGVLADESSFLEALEAQALS